MADARRWMHGYMAKFHAPDNPDPHPPDDKIVAQFLTIAPWLRLLNMIYELMAERQQAGHSYAWFISVANAAHPRNFAGPAQAEKAKLKIAKKQCGEREYTADLVDQLKVAAAMKAEK
jgi:hypothetical protein